MHMLPTDELYNHHLGDPVEMLVLAPAFAETDPVFAEREELVNQYSEFRSMIEALTRLEPHNV